MTSAKVDQVLTQDQVLRQMGLHWNDWDRNGQPTVVEYLDGEVLRYGRRASHPNRELFPGSSFVPRDSKNRYEMQAEVLYPIVALSHFAPITLTTMRARRNRGS